MSRRLFQIDQSPSQELLALLDSNVIGTPGQGMLYQHRGVHNKINLIANPHYVNLVRDQSIVGTCCFCKRITISKGVEATSFYVRYFSFRDVFRRRKLTVKSIIRKSSLREEIKSILDGNGLNVSAQDKFYHYAYVDPRNNRSVSLCEEFGFEPVRQFTTIIFNRLRPKQHKERKIEVMTSAEEKEIKHLLTDFYKDYSMFSWENLFGTRKYFLIRNERGEITAGVQANPDLWKILSLPGATGKMILGTFTHIPYLNRLFSTNYKFVTLEGIYYKPGSEKDLEILFEYILHHYQMHSAIIPLDADTSLYRTLKSLQLGLANKLSKEVRGNVIAKFIHFNENEKDQFKSSPAYISGIDVT